MSTKFESITMAVINAYREAFKDEQYPRVITTDRINQVFIQDLIVKGIITEFTDHEDKSIFRHSMGLMNNRERLEFYLGHIKIKPDLKWSEVPSFHTKTGLFTFRLKGVPMALAIIPIYKGVRIDNTMGFIGGDLQALRGYSYYEEIDMQVQEAPKPGIYRIHTSNGLLFYKKIKENFNVQVIHPMLNIIQDHVSAYFQNINALSSNSNPGRKAILLYGPQGTGKTSIIKIVVNHFAKTHCIVFGTNMETISWHTNLCAKHGIPTIIVAEDFMDNSDDQKVVSLVKNFLSGVDTSTNKQGCYMMMTSNYPERIDPTVIFRKGRIDRLFNIGKLELKGEDLVRCFDLYVNKFLRKKDQQEQAMKIMTEVRKMAEYDAVNSISELSGSEIETIVKEAIILSHIKGESFAFEHIMEILKEMQLEIEEVKKFSQQNNFMMKNQSNDLGFRKSK